MRKINILFLIDNLAVLGGTENYLFRLVTNLNKEKFSCIVCPFAPKESIVIKKFREYGIAVTPILVNRIYTWDALKAVYNLKYLIKQKKIDIVQTFHFSSDIYGTIVSRLLRVPIIISSRRDMGFAEYDIHHRFLRRIANFFVNTTLTNAKIMNRQVCNVEKIPVNKTVTIYNGLKLENYDISIDRKAKAEEFNLSIRKPIIGCIANIRPIKGLEYLIKAAAKVTKEYPEAQFIIVGGNADAISNTIINSYKNKLNLMINKLNLNQQIYFLGKKSNINEILKIMDIFVLPSLSEGFSNSIIEAMAAGVPVIATNVGGNPEAIEHNKTGFIVPVKNSTAIAEKIKKLLKYPKLREQLGQAGRLWAEHNYNIKKIIKQNENLYCSLLNQYLENQKKS